MSTRYVLPIPTTPENAAKRQTMELLASERVTGNYLRLAVLALLVTTLGGGLFGLKAMQMLHNFKPIVIHVDDLGRPQAERLETGPYHPRETEVKYFLGQFVTDFYGRMRATAKERFMRSLYFLDPPLARAVFDENRKSKMLETFLAGQGDEVEIVVKKIVLQELRTSPYRAAVDFERVYYGADHEELRRESYTGNFVFTVKDQVPNNLILINPLGFTITYLREDQAFK